MSHEFLSIDFLESLKKVVPKGRLSGSGWLAFLYAWANPVASNLRPQRHGTELKKAVELILQLNDSERKPGSISRIRGQGSSRTVAKIKAQAEQLVNALKSDGVYEPWPDFAETTPDGDYFSHLALNVASAVAIQSDARMKYDSTQYYDEFESLADHIMMSVSYCACIQAPGNLFADVLDTQADILDDQLGGRIGKPVERPKITKLVNITKDAIELVIPIPFQQWEFGFSTNVAAAITALLTVVGLLGPVRLSKISGGAAILGIAALVGLYLHRRSEFLGHRTRLAYRCSAILILAEACYLIFHLTLSW